MKNLNQVSSCYSKWKIGDEIEISENQKVFFQSTYAISVLNSIEIPYRTKKEIEKMFRKFIEQHPVLSVRFTKKQGTFFQEYIAASDVKLMIRHKKIKTGTKSEILKKESLSFLKKPCDAINGELIRVMVFMDETRQNNLYLVVGVHQILIDMHTNIILRKNLSNCFNNRPYGYKYLSNFDFAEWQKKHLLSEIGLESRKFWRDFLTKANLEPTDLSNRPKKLVGDYMEQKVVITGSRFRNLRNKIKSIHPPLLAILLSIHQRLINAIFNTKNFIQVVRVDGRENNIKDLEVKKILGMMTNSLPLPIVKEEGKSSTDFILEVYIDYCNARMHHHIPFGIIKKDFQEATGMEIDQYLIGVFNFITLKVDKKVYPDSGPDVNFSIEKKLRRSNEMLNLNINLFQNAFEIELICPNRVYEKSREVLDLKSIIEKKILIPNIALG